MPERPNLHLAVGLDGPGWHPAAWRDERARPGELFSPGHWVDLTQEAERGLLDLVTFDDSLSLQWPRRGMPDDRTDQGRGRLDAVMVAARVAPGRPRVLGQPHDDALRRDGLRRRAPGHPAGDVEGRPAGLNTAR